MTQYWEDWSGSTIGQSPAGWTRRFNTTGITYEVVSDAAGPAGRALLATPSSVVRRFLSFDAVNGDSSRADFEIRVLMTAPALKPTAAVLSGGVAGRASGASSSESIYIGDFYGETSATSSRTVAVHKYVSGAAAVLLGTGTAASYTTGQRYWLGLKISGTSVRQTLAAEATPGTLIEDKTYTDTSISAAGWIGLALFSDHEPFRIYAVGIGTGGDPAPLSSLADTTAPTLSGASGTATGTTTANGSVTTNEGNGTLYWLASTSATATAAAVKAGSNQAVTASGAQSVNVTGLTSSTSYYVHFLHQDAALNDSAVATSAQFTTSAVQVKGVSLSMGDGSTPITSVSGLTVLWWDSAPPTGAPYETSGAIDASGKMVIDLDAVTALAVGAYGTIGYVKHGATAIDDKGNLHRAQVADIS